MLRPTLFKRNESPLFRSLFDDFFEDMSLDYNTGSFKTDIIDKGDHYVLQAELPGFSKEDISLNVKDNQIVISASHTDEVDEDKDNYIRKERRYSSYSRAFNVSNIRTEDIKATYNNGILELSMPKQAEIDNDGRKIDID